MTALQKNFLSTTKLSMLSNSRSAEVSQNQSSLALSCKHVFWYCTIRPVLYYIVENIEINTPSLINFQT